MLGNQNSQPAAVDILREKFRNANGSKTSNNYLSLNLHIKRIFREYSIKVCQFRF